MTRERVEPDSSAPRKIAVDLSWGAIFRQYAMFALLGLGIVGGSLYVVYQRIDDELRSRLERSLQEHYGPRGFQVRVRDVVWQEGVGFEIHDLAILDPQSRPMELLHVEEVRIPCDRRLQELLTEDWSPTQIVLKRPKMALVATAGQRPRAMDLFPLPPMRPGGAFPSVTVESGEIAWIDANEPTVRLFESRSIFGTLTPLVPAAEQAVPDARNPKAPVPVPTAFDLRFVGRADRMERVQVTGLVSKDLSDWSMTVDLHRLRATPEWFALARAGGFDVPFAPPKFRGEATIRLTANQKQPLAFVGAQEDALETSPIPFDVAGANAFDGPVSPEMNVTPVEVAAARAKRLPPRGPAPPTPASWLSALPCQLSISGEFVDFEVDDPRLIYPIRDARGSFLVDDTGLSVTSASGRWGAGSIWMQGSVADPLADPHVTGKVKLRDVALDADLAQRLPASAAEAYSEYAPVGKIHADFGLDYARGAWSGEAVVQAAGVTITPRDFPYPIQETVGTLRWKPQSIEVQLVGKAAGQEVRIEGSMADPLQRGPGRIAIRTERPVPIDERLMTAAASANPQAAAFLSQVQLQGTVAAEGALIRERAGEPARLQLALTLAEGSFRHRNVPYPLDDVQGTFRLEERRWSFERVAGRYGTALVIADGWVQTDPALGRRMSLKAVGSDVPIDESFLQSLQGSARTTCREMQLRGTLDQASVEWSYDFDSRQSDFALRAWKWRLPPERATGGDISLQPGCFPYLFENVTGELLYQDGRLSLTKLRGKHGEETWTGDVTWERLSEGGWTFALANLGVDRLQIHDQLRQALPADASRFFIDRDVQGTFAVRGGLRVTRPTERDPVATDWDVAIDVERGSFGSTFPLQHLHGEVQLAGRMDVQGFRSRGELRIDSAMFRDYQITSLSGPVAVDSKQVLIGAWAEPRLVDRAPRSLTGTLFGGKVECDCQIQLDEAKSFTVQMRLNDGDLTSLAQNAASGYQEISGKIDALLNLTGSGEGAHTMRGSGFVRLNDARIYEAPLVTTLLKSLPGKSPETPLFQTTDIDFRVQGSHVYLDRCNFHGDAITLKGQGEIGFDRSISLDFYAVAGKDKLQIPVITPALGIASRQILQIHVDGTLDSPVVENKPLPVLKETLDQVFPEAKPQPEVARLPSPLKWLQDATRY